MNLIIYFRFVCLSTLTQKSPSHGDGVGAVTAGPREQDEGERRRAQADGCEDPAHAEEGEEAPRIERVGQPALYQAAHVAAHVWQARYEAVGL